MLRHLLGSLPRRIWIAGLLVLVVAAAAILTTGCGTSDDVGDGGPVSTPTTSSSGAEVTTTTQPTVSTTSIPSNTTSTTAVGSDDTITLRVYFARNEKICAASRVIPKTQEVGAAAMKALLQGPTADEKQAGMVSTIPEGTTFLGLNVENGIATVDLSKEYESGGGSLSMFMRLAEVVFTLTQFSSVQGVNFKLDGEPIEVLGGEGIIIDHPMTRADFEDQSPVILVESPTLGTTAASPLRVTGTANVFEAVFRVEIVDAAGLEIVDEMVQATSGTGTRGTFDVTLRFNVGKPGPGSLIVYYDSPKDGSKVLVDEIPIVLQ
jgi:spore germination protein GerM